MLSFLLTPILLPLLDNSLQYSLSQYHYTSQRLLYLILLGSIGVLTMLDGVLYDSRRYNILIGLSMIGVISFPCNEYIITHYVFAIFFFVGNAIIATYYSKLLPKSKKTFFKLVIFLTLFMLLFDYINIYVTESIGMLSMAYFMYTRYSILELRRKTFV